MNENIEVTPSADNGNVPVDAPSVEPKTVIPAASPDTAVPAEPELYELPDGRKVDAETLSKEWKENFYPDYTRKSQALAAKEQKPELTESKPEKNPLTDPDWTPKSYAELIDIAKNSALKEIETKEQERITQRQAVEDAVANQLTELKKFDASLNENALFLHANKYGFRDLKQAYQNMKDMGQIVKNVQQTTARNVAKRADPVSISPGATGVRPDPSQFANARDYLRSLNK